MARDVERRRHRDCAGYFEAPGRAVSVLRGLAAWQHRDCAGYFEAPGRVQLDDLAVGMTAQGLCRRL